MEKIVFKDGTVFETADYPCDTEPSLFEKKRTSAGVYREFLRMTVCGEYADIAGKFTDGAEYSVRRYDTDGEGNVLDTFIDYDKSEFSVAGDIVDHRDGRITVYMGKKTEDELEKEQLVAALEAAGVNVYEA